MINFITNLATAFILLSLTVFVYLVFERYCGLFSRLYFKLTGKSFYKE